MEKVPPHDLEAEMAVLGSVLLDGRAMNDLVSFLRPEHFYSSRYAGIYTIFMEMWEAKRGIDVITVKRECDVRKFSVDDLPDCLEVASSPAMASHYGKIVMEMAHLRSLGNAAADVGTLVEDRASVGEAVAVLSAALASVQEQASVGTSVTRAHDGILAAVEQASAEGREPDTTATILPWMLCPTFDMRGAQIRATDFPIIAARPGVGKTTFALQWAKVTAQRTGRAVVYISLETPARDLWLKVACNHSGVPEPRGRALPPGDAESLSKAAEDLKASCPLYIIDSPPSDLPGLLALMQRLKERLDPVAFVIDYLGLIEVPRTKGPYEAVSKASRVLRTHALKENIGLIMVHQLSRGMEREKRPPAMHDLRDSGQIEQDATHIVFLHQERISDENDQVREIVAILAKARRGGAPAMQRLHLLANISRFTQRAKAPVRDTPA